MTSVLLELVTGRLPFEAELPGGCPLPAGTLPPAGRGHTAVMDPPRMLVFGGLQSTGFGNDVWQLELTPGAVEWMQFASRV